MSLFCPLTRLTVLKLSGATVVQAERVNLIFLNPKAKVHASCYVGAAGFRRLSFLSVLALHTVI